MTRLPGNFNEPLQHSFCVLPWLHRFVNLGGEVQLCCTAEDYEESYIRTDAGARINIIDGMSDEHIGNTRHMREIRSAMLRGEWPSMCERCRVTELANGESRRCHENRHFSRHIDWILQSTDGEGFAPPAIRSRDFRLGNLCNLRCRMCHPRASKLFLPDFNEASRDRYRIVGETARQYESMNWVDDPALWQAFTRQVGDLEHLHFAGGEPLIIPQVERALAICVEQGVAQNIEVTFNTNITRLSKAHRDLWPHFKAVNLLCSVDALGPLNDYIRYPARWGKIEQNLDRLDREHAALNLGEVVLSATVQVYNVFHIHELVEYAHQRYRFIRPMPNLVHLAYPEHYNIRFMPDKLKALAERRLLDCRERLSAAGVAQGLNQIDGIIAYMRMGRRSRRHMGELRRQTLIFDQQRGERLTDLVPELEPVMRRGGILHALDYHADNLLHRLKLVRNLVRARARVLAARMLGETRHRLRRWQRRERPLR